MGAAIFLSRQPARWGIMMSNKRACGRCTLGLWTASSPFGFLDALLPPTLGASGLKRWNGAEDTVRKTERSG